MNKKGFTMVELLAVIVILGVLGTIGVVVTNKYLVQSREKSYKMMSQTIYEATMNCMIQGKCSVPTASMPSTYDTEYLLQNRYLDTLKNPNSAYADCTGNVKVINNGNSATSKEYEKYQYEVSLNCPGVANSTLIWPDAKIPEENYTCKRATTLHKEQCESASNNTCSIEGNPAEYGNLGTSGTLSVGDAFDCDVNKDGTYNSNTERFYYLADLDSDNNYVVLIYYNNVSGGIASNRTTYAYNSSGQSWYGPLTAAAQLPKTSQWSNIALKNSTRTLKTSSGGSSIKYYYRSQSTHSGVVTQEERSIDLENYNYSRYSARIPTYQEITSGCPTASDSCKFLIENTSYLNSAYSRGYWLENPASYTGGGYNLANANYLFASGDKMYTSSGMSNNANSYGVRPAIEVPKSDISY